jgi:G:T-mismatch repair DNA endonuclease (very short patch repair protein)
MVVFGIGIRIAHAKLARMPKSRHDFWGPKLVQNRLRDERIYRELAEQGWEALTIWECQITDRAVFSEQVRSKRNKTELWLDAFSLVE